MIEREELLEYALVYGEYKGIPKQQVCYYFTFSTLLYLNEACSSSLSFNLAY